MILREKIMVGAGVLVVVLVLGWRLLHTGGAATADTTTIVGAITRIRQGDSLARLVITTARELTVAIPQVLPSEQESAIRQDLARKAQQFNIQMINQKGIEASRGSVRAAQAVQYRLEMYGQFDAFMKLIAALEKSSIPYVIREVNFENAPRAPGEQGQQGGQPGSAPTPGASPTPGTPPPPGGAALDQLPPNMRERAERFLRRGGDGGAPGRGGPQQNQPNGRVHVTMRVQSYLFPAEAIGIHTAAPVSSGASTTPTTPKAPPTTSTAPVQAVANPSPEKSR